MLSLKRIARAVLAAGALLASAESAHATLVNFDLTGSVLFSTGYGGLVAGDSVTVHGIFDDTALSGGSGTVAFYSGNGNSLTITAGSNTFTQANDSLFGASSGPTMTLGSGLLTDFNFGAISGTNSASADFDSYFLNFGSGSDLVGSWSSSVQISPVPVPAAMWLFGSGLLALAGLRRRKN